MIAHILGLSGTGYWYGFWSGIGSDLGEFAVLAVIWRHLTCHADRCHRIGLHHVPGTSYKTCRAHHPTGGTSLEDIHDAHRKAQR